VGGSLASDPYFCTEPGAPDAARDVDAPIILPAFIDLWFYALILVVLVRAGTPALPVEPEQSHTN